MAIILIDNYDSFTYNLYQMVQALTAEVVEVVRNDALDFAALKNKNPSRIILSPGPGHPAVDRDFGVCRDVITNYDALPVPVLGICLGHQGMAQHSGGQVIQAPAIVHGKTSQVQYEKDTPIFAGLPNPFTAMRYHSLIVDEKTLPSEFSIVAREVDYHLPMAMTHAHKKMVGIQFHPESIGTPEGSRILQNFLENY